MQTKLKILTAALLLAAANAGATVLTFDLNHNYGSVDAGGNVLVTMTEASTAGDVKISITNNTLGFLNKIHFNYFPSTAVADATFYNFSYSGGFVAAPTMSYTTLQGFAFALAFPNAASTRFDKGETVSFDLTTSADLLVNGFNTLGGRTVGDDYYVGVHINSVAAHGSCGTGSAKLGDANGGNIGGDSLIYDCADPGVGISRIPEPATTLLMALGIAGFSLLRRKTI